MVGDFVVWDWFHNVGSANALCIVVPRQLKMYELCEEKG
jgi:hypothetical protein